MQKPLCSTQSLQICVHKYGPLFELTYGQTMARRRATYEFDPLRGKIDRGALVPLPEVPTIAWR